MRQVRDVDRKAYAPLRHDDPDLEAVRDVLKYYGTPALSLAAVEDLAILIKRARGE